jgi:hypothetical protein
MRMARDAGHADANAVLESMTADQVCELLALEELEPRGPNREDFRIAQLICWIVGNIPFRGKDATTPKASDIFGTLRTDPLANVMSGSEIASAFRKAGVKRRKQSQPE